MAGALVHITSGILLALSTQIKGYGRKYMIGGFIGTLLPDAFIYVVASFYYGTFDLLFLINTKLWGAVYELTNPWLALTLVVFFASVLVFIYQVHVIEKKRFWQLEEVDWFILIGVVIHLLLDWLWIETGWLI